ncbi:monocarboxylate transporter 14-like [Ruditapes philippinarum]|uniref:monocarboxylate transporter 14-like n=1 Tax=Ruditapes philippinarum TaxID=129788 RepID=UPI00295ABD4A|nr:monocarboxylate transporter 14-like [Ruditapes philippinarum]
MPRSIGNSFSAVPLPVLLAFHFDKWRNITVGILVVFSGVGMLIASPLLLYLIDRFGFSGSFLIVSGLTLQVCIGGLFCSPSSKERKVLDAQNNATMDTKNTRSFVILKNIKLEVVNVYKLIKNVRFILFLLSTSTWNLVLSACSSHLPRYMVTKGLGKDDVITVMTIFSLSNIFGRLLAATTTGKDGLDYTVIHFGSLGVLGLSSTMFVLYSNYIHAVYIFAAICGFYTGSTNSLMIPIAVDLIGIEHLSGGNGLLYFSAGVGGLVGPPFTGLIQSVTGSYEICFMSLGCVTLVGTVSSLIAFRGRAASGRERIDTNIKINTIVPTC